MTFAAVTRIIAEAIYDKLDTDLGDIPVGDGIAPDPAGDVYVVIDSMDGTVRSDMDQAYNRVKYVVQVRSVALTAEGARYAADLVASSLLDRTLSVTGLKLMLIDDETSGRVFRDDDADPTSRFTAMGRYAFHFDARS